jgi:hypothetical protein
MPRETTLTVGTLGTAPDYGSLAARLRAFRWSLVIHTTGGTFCRRSDGRTEWSVRRVVRAAPVPLLQLAIRPATPPLWAEVVTRRTGTMDCKRVAKPTGAAPPPRATSLRNRCDQTICFDDGWSDNACVGHSRKTDNKCCTQNYRSNHKAFLQMFMRFRDSGQSVI